MFSDRAKALARGASRFLRRSRNFHLTILLTLAIPWFAVIFRLESGEFPYIPHAIHVGEVLRERYATATHLRFTERCLMAQGIYIVKATEAIIIEPFTAALNDRGWLEEVTNRGREREHCSVHHPYFHHMGVWNIQPIFAIPARSEAIDSCTEKDLACYYDIAVNYFARRRGTVIKTRKPFRYICRAVLQKSTRQAPADYQEIRRTIRRTVNGLGRHTHIVILTTAVKIASPRRRSILCEALTPEDKLLFDYCENLDAQATFPRMPIFHTVASFGEYMFPRPSRVYAVLPLAKGQMFWPNMFCLAFCHLVELVFLTVLYFCLWGLLRQCICFLETCAHDEIDCTTNEALRWLVPASHRLHDHHENLVTEKIITPQQYVDLYVRGKTRGKMYIHHLLRRFIVTNNTMDQLRVYMAEAGIDNEDGYQSQTSSESDSDNDTNENPLAIMAVCQIFINPYEDSSLERLLELEYITSHQYVRIYDTREARGSFAAGALLIRLVQGNNKGKEFLLWFCEQFQATEDQVRRIALAVSSHMFHCRSISRTESLLYRISIILLYYAPFMVVSIVIFYLYHKAPSTV